MNIIVSNKNRIKNQPFYKVSKNENKLYCFNNNKCTCIKEKNKKKNKRYNKSILA